MGFVEYVQKVSKENKEKSEAKRLKKEECARDTSLKIHIVSGYRELCVYQDSILRQKTDGYTYFNLFDDVGFRLVGYEWAGPVFQQITTSNTQGNSKTTKKGKTGRMATGAVVGTLLMPGVGTIVGTAIGAGGKSKSSTNTNTNTKQITQQVEKDGVAVIRLKKIDTGSIHSITVTCNSQINSQIRCLNFDVPQTISNQSKQIEDSLNGIKALKELLDIGAITQEEYDLKKTKLLNQ